MMLKLVQNVKNHIAALIKNEDFIELFDIEDNSVIFSISTIDQIAEGVSARPDGEHIFSDGMKVVIENGVVTSVEKPEQEIVEVTETVEAPVEEVVEEKIEDSVKSEEVTEGQHAEEPAVEENNEYEEKERLLKENEELKIKIEELTAEIEKLKEENDKKDADIKEAESCLKEVQNFYSKVSNNSKQTRVDNTHVVEEPKSNFRIIK